MKVDSTHRTIERDTYDANAEPSAYNYPILKIEVRVQLLFDCLVYDSETEPVFSVGERIMINQERFRWSVVLLDSTAVPWPVSDIIEAKIQKIQSEINY